MTVYEQFEVFCEYILRKEGFKIIATPRTHRREHRADFLTEDPNGERTIVEARLYRSTVVDIVTVRNAIRQLYRYMEHENCKRGILIVLGHFGGGDFKGLSERWVQIWDIEELMKKAAVHGLSEILSLFLGRHETGEYVSVDLANATQILLQQMQNGAGGSASSGAAPSPSQLVATMSQARGKQILDKLASVASGQEDSRVFEGACSDALKYLFKDDFEGWKEQHRVEDGHRVNDLIARCAATEGLWRRLQDDFRSRYVIFEFKNYSQAITQNQIYLTEKYLYAGALRTVALIVAHNGCDVGAERAIKAALRESGKLIVCISLLDLKEMIEQKDEGKDYMELLSERVDQLLTDLIP